MARSPRIPFFSQAVTFERIWPEIRESVDRVFDNGKFSHGAQVAELERRLAGYTGARHVVGVNSGTDALVLLLRAAGLRPGDGVLVPAYSFIATASAVTLAGGRPRFTDIDPVTYAMDPSSAADAVTADTRFVLPAHLFTQMANMPALASLAAERGLVLLEDSAEGIGMRRQGRHAGLWGAGGVLSFFPSKTLGAIGDAGAVLTDDPVIAHRVDALRHHGRSGRTIDDFPGIANESDQSGVNSKMDDLQAAVLLAKMNYLDAEITRRNALAERYTKRLMDCPGIIRTPTTVDVCYVYLVEVDRRNELVDHLAAHGIATETYYPTPLHRQPCFSDLGYREGEFPHAEAACRHAVALPLYPDLGLVELDRVCEVIWDFFTGKGT